MEQFPSVNAQAPADSAVRSLTTAGLSSGENAVLLCRYASDTFIEAPTVMIDVV
jgi:hypothetical protein